MQKISYTTTTEKIKEEKMPSQEAMHTVSVFLILGLTFLCFKIFMSKQRSVPINWPVLGMNPSLLLNTRRLFEFITDFLSASGGTFLLKGPSLANMDILFTSDPANVHYVLTKNFQNFGKGLKFKNIFDVLGQGIFTAEGESWENQRKVTKSFMANNSFQQFSARTTWEKVENGLLKVLEWASETGMVVDIQEFFQRLAFDCSCITVLGHDPGSLCKELPNLPEEKAFADAEEAILYRYVVPAAVWNLQKWLNIGTEKRLSNAKVIFDRFLSECITSKEEKDDHDILSCYKRAVAQNPDALNISKDLWKDVSLSLLAAGKDTISASLAWFFWLLAKNPEHEKKIREEIAANAPGGAWNFSDTEELRKLVYLHGALCEMLRLYPPVALQQKTPLQDDILPSGHHVKANMKVVLSFYSMGRMESIWGEDCLEFKPERWISDNGRTKALSSINFPAFNAGPRSCLGKEMSFVQLKIVVAAVISRFTIRVVEEHPVIPKTSIILHMKHGLKVKVSNYEKKSG